jgi:ribosomal-protein-alanine N-acetyltransferase
MGLTIPVRLETDRLVIRPFRETDLDGFLEFMLDPGCTKYMLFTDEQKTREGATALLKMVVDAYGTPGEMFSVAVTGGEDGRYIGSVGLGPVADSGDIQIYWSVVRNEWGKGYATEAARALLGHAFDVAGLQAVAAYSHPENTASEKVAGNLGMNDMGLVEWEGGGKKARRFLLTAETSPVNVPM